MWRPRGTIPGARRRDSEAILHAWPREFPDGALTCREIRQPNRNTTRILATVATVLITMSQKFRR